MPDTDDNDLDIYINNKKDKVKDKLYTYLSERRANKKVNYILT
jgi:flagellar motor switch protein FliG